MDVQKRSERVVTVHLAIECIVEGDADASAVAQAVCALTPIPQMSYATTVITPRAVGLIRSDEKLVNPRHDQGAGRA